jgi:phenylpropionate dioxygenase-like ring-hydroxylating dioxygenase large terminal subunit
MTYYPDVMLEWYPNALVVSTIVARGPERTTNVVEFYYPEEIALFEREFVEAQQAAYLETAAEDAELCARVARGRRALYDQGGDDAGPYQSPLEDTLRHFHQWLRARLARQPAGPA